MRFDYSATYNSRGLSWQFDLGVVIVAPILIFSIHCYNFNHCSQEVSSTICDSRNCFLIRFEMTCDRLNIIHYAPICIFLFLTGRKFLARQLDCALTERAKSPDVTSNRLKIGEKLLTVWHYFKHLWYLSKERQFDLWQVGWFVGMRTREFH